MQSALSITVAVVIIVAALRALQATIALHGRLSVASRLTAAARTVSTTQLSKQSHDERATNTFENSVGQSFLHLIRSRPRAAASARPTLNIKRRTEQNHKPNSRFLVPLVAVLGCLLTVWVVLVSEGRGTFKPFLRVTERWGIDLRGIEGGYDVIRKSFGIKTAYSPKTSCGCASGISRSGTRSAAGRPTHAVAAMAGGCTPP